MIIPNPNDEFDLVELNENGFHVNEDWKKWRRYWLFPGLCILWPEEYFYEIDEKLLPEINVIEDVPAVKENRIKRDYDYCHSLLMQKKKAANNAIKDISKQGLLNRAKRNVY